ncbi:MAG: response regulator [Candidatus Cloacimonetes bacterium]|nr:response regulator [Candidatus Cloacimonadota bacterium]
MMEANDMTILIVDDIRSNINILSEIFKHEYIIKVTNNGKDALRIIQGSKQPDIILLDIMMPEMNGYEVCKILKNSENTKNIPVIFITAMEDEKDEEYGLSLGAIDYITKPFAPNLVKSRVRNHLEKRKIEKMLQKSLIDIKKAYKDLELSQEKIIKLEQKNTAFAMAVTANHEINQPLAIINNCVELLKLKVTDDKLLSYYIKIENAVERINNILNKFKNLSEVSFKKYLDDVDMLDIDHN